MKKFLGQHFLVNEEAIERIVAAVGVKTDDTIIEIGPGAGAITKPLADICSQKGARLFAIEKDTQLVIAIQKEISLLAGNVEHGDALEVLPKLVSRLTASRGDYKIVGNIPYYITGNLLRVIGELERKPNKIVLMVQKEVAERVSSKPPEMNLLAAATQAWADTEILFTLSRKDFSPPPEVDSAVIVLTPNGKTPDETYYTFIKIAFKQPRKKLINNLVDGFPNLSKEAIGRLMAQNGLQTDVRGQNLTVEQLYHLSRIFTLSESA